MAQQKPSTLPAPTVESSSSAYQPKARSALVDGLTARLLQLCGAAELTAGVTQGAERVFRDLIVPWSRVEAFSRSPNSGWISDISDDNTPIEFSATLSPAGSEIRVLFEPQGEEPALASHRQAALRMHEELASEYGADLSRFELVRELFTPEGMQGPFALWSAVVFANGKPPAFKAYFNPQARGPGSAVSLVEEGLRRLGLPRAWRHLAATMARRGPHRDELKYFALDLSESQQARVKVYVRHHDATPGDLQIAASAARDSNHGEAEDFARAIGGGARRFKDRATFTCAAFVSGDDDRPSATTQYVPVCAYAIDDLEVEQRVASYLVSQNMDSAPYRRLLAAYANRPLNAGVGMQSWVAFRRYRNVPRLTIYLGTELRTVFPPGSVPAGTRDHMAFDSASAVLEAVGRYPLEKHPLFERIARNRDSSLLGLLANNTLELLALTTELEVTEFRSWVSELPEATGDADACQHLFSEALATFQESSDRLESAAAEAVAATIARSLARALTPVLRDAENSSVTFSADSFQEPAADAERSSRLERAGERGLPSIVRGAFGVHQRLWAALDRIELVSKA